MIDHPITPPPELVQQWIEQGVSRPPSTDYMTWFATQAASWGADMELEACCEWLRKNGLFETRIGHLRTARRPKPPSLKEQALTALSEADQGLNESEWQQRSDTIRRALEALPE